MIDIAICDDDTAITTAIEEMLLKLAEGQNIKINCEVFFDGSTLVENIHQGAYYDLIYLDIEMDKINGINAAELIRSMEIPTLIVYVSGYEKYLKELFNTEPFRFLSKPIDEKAFHSVFTDACRRIRQKSEYFSFTYNKEIIKVLLNDIYYFESQNRVVYIHMAESIKVGETKYRFYARMNDVEKRVSASNVCFIRIHQSYLVNFAHIKSMNYTNATMSDGTELQISEDRQKNVRTQFCIMAGMGVDND